MEDPGVDSLSTSKKPQNYSSLNIWLEIADSEVQVMPYSALTGSATFSFTAFFCDKYPFYAPKIFLKSTNRTNLRNFLPIE